MPKPPRRTFTLLDAMILIGASAVVVTGLRRLLSDDPNDFSPLVATAEYFPWPTWLITGYRSTGLVLMIASITLLILRLRKPRPSIRRVMRQPGTVACISPVLYSLMSYAARNTAECSVRIFSNAPMSTVLGIQTMMSDPPSLSALAWSYLLPIDHSVIPCIVATSWITLWLARIARSEPSWIDRSGRIVGCAWIAWGVWGTVH